MLLHRTHIFILDLDNIFDITFADSGGEPSEQNGGFRDQNLITVSDNNLTGSNSIIISHTQVGHPINSLAAEPGIPTNSPAGVAFQDHSVNFREGGFLVRLQRR